MKLRTQFVFLIIGIIAVPFLVTSFILLLDYTFSRGQEPLPNYGHIFAWIRRDAPRAFQTRDFKDLASHKPDGLDVIVLGRDNSIAFSTISQLPEGTTMASGDVLAFIRANVGLFHFQIDAPRAASTASGTGTNEPLLILKVPRIREDPEFRNQAVQIMMYSMIAVLAFSSLMSYLILRSLNRSIVTLEGATRRVSEGDLDFELPVRGNNEISSLTRSFDRMRNALKEEYARRARFIMGVSHDLKTPLALIQGYVEAITDGFAGDPDVQKKYLSIIQDKTQSLEGMIGDLIEFVKMETGEWRMTFREVAAGSFFTDIAKRYAEDALILHRRFDFSVELPPDLTVSMDEGLVSRALENLLGNAIRYTVEDGKIGLVVRREGEEVVVSISDSGIGIPQAEITRIFDPFYRGTNSRREQGFGLGLTTVKSIMEGHGWGIGVSSNEGQGTTFTIRMPVAKADAPAGGIR
jgi:signal transduction histidine kinase